MLPQRGRGRLAKSKWVVIKWKNLATGRRPCAFSTLPDPSAATSTRNPKPLVLLVDEIDSLVGDSLISVLRQIRSGYDRRPFQFPQSVVLCGVRDVRDYRIRSHREKSVITGGSAFNIKAESLRLGNFTRGEVRRLYALHTEETGQKFRERALDLVWEYTRGQPWLVNALGYEACFKMEKGRDRSSSVTEELIAEAKENLVLRRETHLDQLADKLREERVRRVVGPMLGGGSMENIAWDDVEYVLDLGLIARSPAGLEVSNAIYKEIIPRELTAVTQYNLEPLYRPFWYVSPDGRLDTDALFAAFQEFFREHSKHWVERFDYKEAGPHLLLQAFLQRIVNSGGRIDREYGLGRTLAEGLEQTAQYMDKCGSREGHLVIFDRRPGRKWSEKIFRKAESREGRSIVAWGM